MPYLSANNDCLLIQLSLSCLTPSILPFQQWLSFTKLNSMLPIFQVPDVVEAALREADADHDGSVGLADLKSFLMSQATDDSLSLFDSRVSRDGSVSSGGEGEGSNHASYE